MIRIALDEPTLARTRIAISPLWETVCSLFLLDRAAPGSLGFPYDRWEPTARAAYAEHAEVLSRVRGARFPDCLCPAPESATPSIIDELAVLAATPDDVIEAGLLGYDDPVLAVFRRPGEVRRWASALHAYWEKALEPVWGRMRAALDEEVLNRARALATDGPDRLLADLHDRVRWEPPTLTLVKREEADIRGTDRRLLLIPLIFSRGALMCSSENPDVIAVSYQARGAVVLADEQPPSADDGLALLLGKGRAQVLRALATPSTTMALAGLLGLAPSTVSEHLSVLVTAGVAWRRRAGRRVLYGLEPAGLAMVSLIAPQSRAAA